MKILLTGGGTAGHVSGNTALMPELKRQGFEIEYIGSYTGMEKDIIGRIDNVKYHAIPSGKLNRSFTINNIRDAFRVLKGISAATKLMKQIKPDIVFSKGGYVTVPVVIAAHNCKIPVIIHESDFTPGLANKISAKFASKICTTFPQTVKYFKSSKAVCTGSPIRNEILYGNRDTGRAICGFYDSKPVIMVMGGSTGALALNKLIREALNELLPKYNIIHICGKDGVDDSLSNIHGYKQFAYVSEELPHLLAATDLAFSRAGSNAIFEFLALYIPMLLVPLPKDASRGDQIINAESFQNQGFAITCPQSSLTASMLCRKLDELYDKRDLIRGNMRNSKLLNGTKNILSMIFELTNK